MTSSRSINASHDLDLAAVRSERRCCFVLYHIDSPRVVFEYHREDSWKKILNFVSLDQSDEIPEIHGLILIIVFLLQVCLEPSRLHIGYPVK